MLAAKIKGSYSHWTLGHGLGVWLILESLTLTVIALDLARSYAQPRRRHRP
jgi:hypothetical protein